MSPQASDWLVYAPPPHSLSFGQEKAEPTPLGSELWFVGSPVEDAATGTGVGGCPGAVPALGTGRSDLGQ